MKSYRNLIIGGCSALALSAAFLFPDQSIGQAPTAAQLPATGAPAPVAATLADDSAELSKLLAEVADQQAKLAETQTVIDQRLAQIEENVRIAKIFVSRGGGAK